MKIIATTIKGTEYIVRSEIEKKLADVKIEKASLKNVLCSTNKQFQDLKTLRTPDDLQIHIASGKIRGNSTYRDILYSISLSKNTIQENVEKLAKFRKITESFNITVTTTKGSQITSKRLTKEVAKAIERVTDLKYDEDTRNSLDFRVFIDSENFYISLRIFELPHFHKPYKVETANAALRPSLAACMIHSIDTQLDGKSLLDPMCGGGTILCEAYLEGINIHGGDLLNENVKKSLINLKTLGFEDKIQLHIENASKTSWPNNTFDLVISNPPWGKQIKLSESYNPDKILDECIRVAKPNAHFRFLTTDKVFIKKFNEKLSKTHKTYEIQLGHLGQRPKILCANSI